MQPSDKEIDCTFKTEAGNFNFRTGAVIINEKKVLMARNPNDKREYYYSVGGRVKFGECLTDAMLRELREETGLDCEIEKMLSVHENFFKCDDGIPYHEISVYFLIRLSDELAAIKDGHLTDHGPDGEYLVWIDTENCSDKTLYPEFLKTLDPGNTNDFFHYVTNDM